jgi:hypothetical protein
MASKATAKSSKELNPRTQPHELEVRSSSLSSPFPHSTRLPILRPFQPFGHDLQANVSPLVAYPSNCHHLVRRAPRHNHPNLSHPSRNLLSLLRLLPLDPSLLLLAPPLRLGKLARLESLLRRPCICRVLCVVRCHGVGLEGPARAGGRGDRAEGWWEGRL